MRKRYLFIFLVLIIVIGIIIFNVYLFNEKDNSSDYNYSVITNDKLSSKHCEKDICISKLELVNLGSSDEVVMKGYIENKTTEILTVDVSFIFLINDKRKTYKMDFKALKSLKKQYFEYHINDYSILDSEDYVLEVS